jgi:hypothetical protein
MERQLILLGIVLLAALGADLWLHYHRRVAADVSRRTTGLLTDRKLAPTDVGGYRI